MEYLVQFSTVDTAPFDKSLVCLVCCKAMLTVNCKYFFVCTIPSETSEEKGAWICDCCVGTIDSFYNLMLLMFKSEDLFMNSTKSLVAELYLIQNSAFCVH